VGRDLVTVLDAVLDGVVVLDARATVEEVNAEACRILESSAEALRGRFVEGLLGGEHAVARLARAALEGGSSASSGEQTLTGRTRGDLVVDVSASPIFAKDGRPDGVVVMLRDRTLHRALQSQAAGRERLDAFGRVAAGLAHEIKNPLGGIRGAGELITLRSDDPKVRDAAELVVREAERIATLVDDFTVFSEREALRLRETNLHQVLDGVLDLLAVDPVGAKARVERIYDPSIPEFLADADRLTQVFLNLARNALQAMEPEAGTLGISTRMLLDQRLATERGARVPSVAVEVSDTGAGIPDDLLAQVRTPFFTTRTNGTGLGLAVAEYWTTRHGGTLAIESTPGRGTIVRVTLPLRRKT
jgi:two-component system nitrogen regulation sensor histidine kinase GlnL